MTLSNLSNGNDTGDELLAAFPIPPSYIPPSVGAGSSSNVTAIVSTSTSHGLSIPARQRTTVPKNLSSSPLDSEPNPPPSHPPSTPLPPLPFNPNPLPEQSAPAFGAAVQALSSCSNLSVGSRFAQRSQHSTNFPNISTDAITEFGVSVQGMSVAPLRIRTDVASLSRTSNIVRSSVVSPDFAIISSSPDERRERGRPKSPTASLFSTSSRMSGLSTAESLRTRVSGMLSDMTIGIGPNGGLSKRDISRSRTPGLLTAEDLQDVRAVSPLSPIPTSSPTNKQEYERDPTCSTCQVSSPTSASSSLTGNSKSGTMAHLSKSPIDSTTASSNSTAPAESAKMRQHPQSPPPSSFPKTSIVKRTMSQSRTKPLPPAPLHSSIPSSSMSRKAEGDAYRAEKAYSRSISPDIATILSLTPRPGKRLSSRSMSSTRSRLSSGSNRNMAAANKAERSRSAHTLQGISFMKSKPSGVSHDSRARISQASSTHSTASYTSSGSGSTRGRQSFSFNVAGPSAQEEDELLVSGGTEDAYGGMIDDDDDTVGDVSVDYGIAIARHRGGYDLPFEDDRTFYAEDVEMHLGEDRKEREGSGSDSDIDLHTPLPQILLREGVLSPNSKVLASMPSCLSLGALSSGGRDSVVSNMTSASITSVMTKSGLFKDGRDTERRRQRHRNEKLLREGLGLTTGLGWSDSEDEDAPSPLTHRLSKLALSRKSSQASLHSTVPSRISSSQATPKSRSVSGMSLSSHQMGSGVFKPHPLSKSMSVTNLVLHTAAKTRDEFGHTLRSAPPSASPYTNNIPKNPVLNYSLPLSPDLDSNRDSVASSTSSGKSKAYGSSSMTSPPNYYRFHVQSPKKIKKTGTPTSSIGSTFSLTVSIPETAPLEQSEFGVIPRPAVSAQPRKRRVGDGDRKDKDNGDRRSMSPTPTSGTTSSSTSLPFPPTPSDNACEEQGVEDHKAKPHNNCLLGSANKLVSAKANDGMRKILEDENTPDSSLSMTQKSKTPTSSMSRLRPRSLSSSKYDPSSKSTEIAAPPLPSSRQLSLSTGSSTPRPLHLPALHKLQAGDTQNEKSLQPGQPTPKPGSLLGYNRNLHDRQRLHANEVSSALQNPNSTAVVKSVLIPRTGRAYGSLPSTLVPSSAGISNSATQRKFKSRTGTGMVYRQSSLPVTHARAVSATEKGP